MAMTRPISEQVTFTQDGAGAVERLASDKLKEWVNVKDFGAVGDGITDDTAAIQAAITAVANSPSKTLVLESNATYVCSSNLSITSSNLRIIGNGAVIDGSARPSGANALDTYGIGIIGSAGSNVNITSDITAGDNRLNVTSTAGIVAGDYILVKSTQQFPSGATSTASYKGMIHQVRSVTSATELVLQGGSLFSITALVGGVQNAYVAKLTLVENVQLENVTVRMGGIGKAHTGVYVSYALDPRIVNCRVSAAESVGVAAYYVVGGLIQGGEFTDATSPAAGGGPVTTQYGYGVLPGTATKGLVVSGARIRNCRHAVAGGGTYPAIGVRIEKCFVEGQRLASALHGAAYALDCHEDCIFWVFDDNVVFSHQQPNASAFIDGDGGMLIRGSHTTVINNRIFNTAGYGIRVRNTDGPTSYSKGTVIRGNIIGNCLLGGILLEGGDTAAAISNQIISNNIIYGVGANADGILIAAAAAVTIEGNILNNFGATTRGIALVGTSTNICYDISIKGNQIDGVNGVTISATRAEGLIIADNKITNSADDGIQLITCQRATITGNTISTNTDAADGVSVGTASAAVAITGNVMTKTAAAASAAAGARIASTIDVTANGNVVSGYINGISADSASNWVICTNNNGRDCTTPTNINGAIVNKVVANNL